MLQDKHSKGDVKTVDSFMPTSQLFNSRLWTFCFISPQVLPMIPYIIYCISPLQTPPPPASFSWSCPEHVWFLPRCCVLLFITVSLACGTGLYLGWQVEGECSCLSGFLCSTAECQLHPRCSRCILVFPKPLSCSFLLLNKNYTKLTPYMCTFHQCILYP